METAKIEVTADELLRGVMAALICKDKQTFHATQPDLHLAFYRVVEKVKGLVEAGKIDVDLHEVDFDPLYGLSGWLDKALTTAQRDRVIGFPNPSYDRVEIKYNREEAAMYLKDLGAPAEVFQDLADTFDAVISKA